MLKIVKDQNVIRTMEALLGDFRKVDFHLVQPGHLAQLLLDQSLLVLELLRTARGLVVTKIMVDLVQPH